MGATQRSISASQDARVRLRTTLFDALTRAQGATTDATRAELFGVDRSTIWRLRNGLVEAQLSLAMRIAQRLDVQVEVLFEFEAQEQAA